MADLIKIQLIGIYERLIDTIYIYISHDEQQQWTILSVLNCEDEHQ